MAPPAGQIRPGRYLWVFALIVVVLYALVFLTGDHKPSPKLGIDLKGGTTVTLTARTLNGQPPTQQQLDEAQQDIEARVNGLGVSGAQVVLNGSNIVITVPGNQGQEAKSLGQTAKLVFRPVTQAVGLGAPTTPSTTTGSSKSSTTTTPKASAKAGATTTPAATTAPKTSNQGLRQGAYQGTSPQDYIAPQAAPATTTPPATTTTAPAAGTSAAAPPAASGGVNPADCFGVTKEQAAKEPPLTREQQSQLINDCIQLRQSSDSTTQQAALAKLNCGSNYSDPLLGNDDTTKPLVACGQPGDGAKYILGPSFLDGTQISDATSGVRPNGAGFVVNVTLKSAGRQARGPTTPRPTSASRPRSCWTARWCPRRPSTRPSPVATR